MTENQYGVDWQRVANVVAFAVILFAVSLLANWAMSIPFTMSAKASILPILYWIIGQLQNTGKIKFNPALAIAQFSTNPPDRRCPQPDAVPVATVADAGHDVPVAVKVDPAAAITQGVATHDPADPQHG